MKILNCRHKDNESNLIFGMDIFENYLHILYKIHVIRSLSIAVSGQFQKVQFLLLLHKSIFHKMISSKYVFFVCRYSRGSCQYSCKKLQPWAILFSHNIVTLKHTVTFVILVNKIKTNMSRDTIFGMYSPWVNMNHMQINNHQCVCKFRCKLAILQSVI